MYDVYIYGEREISRDNLPLAVGFVNFRAAFNADFSIDLAVASFIYGNAEMFVGSTCVYRGGRKRF